MLEDIAYHRQPSLVWLIAIARVAFEQAIAAA
jgi:hypothetical protein